VDSAQADDTSGKVGPLFSGVWFTHSG